jgi:alpha-glucosidase (family GH31 glycosyl hydrolase)
MFKARGSRDIYLPAGAWHDFWTDDRFEGGRWISYQAELDTLPLFVRAGAVIPRGPDLQYATEQTWDPLSFDVYPGAAGVNDFEIADDRRQLRLQLTVGERTVLLKGGPLDYTPIVRIHLFSGAPIESTLGEIVTLT